MRSISVRAALALPLAALVVVAGRPTSAQNADQPPAVVALGVGSPASSARALDARIARMLSAGELVRVSSIADTLDRNRIHEYFSQRHGGVPVLGGGVSRQRVRGATTSAFGKLYSGIVLNAVPQLTSIEVAAGLARASNGVSLATGSTPSLVILPLLDGTFRLTYEATFADGQTRYVDANTGELVRSESAIIHQGTTTVGSGLGTFGDNKKLSTTRSGDAYQTLDTLRPGQIQTRSTQGTNVSENAVLAGAGTVGTDSDNVWSNPALVDAHVHAGWTYDYFNQRHAWAGLDGQNSLINQVVVDRATLQNNAFFLPPQAGNVGLIAYGVSSGNLTFATLDIVGHELMHAVTFFSVRRRTGIGLRSLLIVDGTAPQGTFQGQTFLCDATFFTLSDGTRANALCQNGQFVLASNHSGAINEGFSDVFGTAIEARYQPQGNAPLRSDYLTAEDAMPGGPAAAIASGLVRSLADPASIPLESTGVVRYPDHFDRRVRYVVAVQNGLAFPVTFTIVNGQFVGISTDSGGVHANATLMGHLYYLAVEGGTNRTSGRAVTGVGFGNREQIEKVFFRAMNMLMPPDPTFPTAALVLRQAAVDLYGSNSAAFRAIDGALLSAGL